ncbi:hypothetical protein THRCLA_01760 [Thraustotheca clavata]|uniref:Fibronectin type-III domain-containing protein n=1 Tax=Thraustotheca clavata TaxID=74557 RepID=A0A1W0A7J6_9STRA|nr:hypothetical protein THRCLA_01760 [Thraustotheca clavata]
MARRLFILVSLRALSAQTLSEVPFRTVEAFWSFNDGLNDWAESSTATMEAEVDVDDGYLHGTVIGSIPFVDSPLMALNVVDRHYFVVRMSYEGLCNQGSIILERNQPVDTFTNRKAPFTDPVKMTFSIQPDGMQHIYYIPIYQNAQGIITRIRLLPCSKGALGGQSFHVDWVMIIKAPTVTKVRGCIDKYYDSSTLNNPIANVSAIVTKTNGVHSVFSTQFGPYSLPYATTYNCMENDTITIQGRNFGDTSFVRINGQPCKLAAQYIQSPTLSESVWNEEVLICTLPSNVGLSNPAMVTVQNEEYRGLWFESALLTYAEPINLTMVPIISNIGAHSVDVTWTPPNNLFQNLATTGYQIYWTDNTSLSSLTVGNVTTTTVMQLSRNTTYNISVAAIVEDQRIANWNEVNMYGWRSIHSTGIIGAPSPIATTTTLYYDIQFSTFSASSTFNKSAIYNSSTLGPTGDVGGQGSHGLVLLGHANVQNCNSTSICCDRNANGQCDWTCAALPTTKPTNSSSLTGIRNSTTINVPSSMLPLPLCGPALRLTGSFPYLTGAVWYPRGMNVREGFTTTFAFRLSNPSFHCKIMDDVATHCRSRGGDGFAFVIQNVDTSQIGNGGSGLGYAGMANSLTIEFDTWYNPDLLDRYENHISVQTRGPSASISSHHSYSLGATTEIPDLTDGIYNVKIMYTPYFTPDMAFKHHFQPSVYVSQYLDSGNWSVNGLGCLSIELNNLTVLSVPLHIDQVVQLTTGGRAFLGFTGATGASTWQVHDILNWTFNSLRIPIA